MLTAYGLDCLIYGLDCLICGLDCLICGLDCLGCAIQVGRAQMLTAHASKGLEFQAVFMVCPSTLSLPPVCS